MDLLTLCFMPFARTRSYGSMTYLRKFRGRQLCRSGLKGVFLGPIATFFQMHWTGRSFEMEIF